MTRLALVLLSTLLLSACRHESFPNATLTFERDGRVVRRVTLRELASEIPPVTIESDDPYYGRRKRFRALPLEPVLEYGLQTTRADAKSMDYVLRATDGYAVPVAGEKLYAGGAYLAFRDLDAADGFAPLGPTRIDPSPFYIVWEGSGRRDIETHPRPWQLETISVARFEDRYAHVIPTGAAERSAVNRGYEIVRGRCLRCHALNREGGTIGPDLNVPKSVVEYWSDEQIRAYVRDPRTFRYGRMPPNTDLSDADLDAIVAYLHAMASQKYDGGGGSR